MPGEASLSSRRVGGASTQEIRTSGWPRAHVMAYFQHIIMLPGRRIGRILSMKGLTRQTRQTRQTRPSGPTLEAWSKRGLLKDSARETEREHVYAPQCQGIRPAVSRYTPRSVKVYAPQCQGIRPAVSKYALRSVKAAVFTLCVLPDDKDVNAFVSGLDTWE
ncbi:hypothetical protein CRUP_034013 [Coryphaenoides rupestris]|nr:hypothetical protein CRUP_034013 [Coryphaenoides rupestris]